MRFIIQFVLLVTICVAVFSRADGVPVDNDEHATMEMMGGVLDELQNDFDKHACDPKKFDACFGKCFNKIPLIRCRDRCLARCLVVRFWTIS